MEQSGLETLVIGANSEFVKKDKPGVIEYDICRNNGNIKKLIFEKGIIETGGAAFMGCYNLAVSLSLKKALLPSATIHSGLALLFAA